MKQRLPSKDPKRLHNVVEQTVINLPVEANWQKLLDLSPPNRSSVSFGNDCILQNNNAATLMCLKTWLGRDQKMCECT